MEKLTLNLPVLYGDHHVTEVRRILQALAGVEEVYASSCFHTVEVGYDPAKIDSAAIEASLEEAGYLDEFDMPEEADEPAYGRENDSSAFRHTMAFEQTQQTVSFGHTVTFSGRPLWPCPGMGPVVKVDNGENGNG